MRFFNKKKISFISKNIIDILLKYRDNQSQISVRDASMHRKLPAVGSD
jgi:hypothetical protein